MYSFWISNINTCYIKLFKIEFAHTNNDNDIKRRYLPKYITTNIGLTSDWKHAAKNALAGPKLNVKSLSIFDRPFFKFLFQYSYLIEVLFSVYTFLIE